jgi:hypothetical protein
MRRERGHYPDLDIVVLDPRFQSMVLGNTAIERIAIGFRFTAGLVYYGDGRYLPAFYRDYRP